MTQPPNNQGGVPPTPPQIGEIQNGFQWNGQQWVPLGGPPAPAKRSKPWYKRWWVWVIAILVLGGLINAVVGGDDKKAAPATESTPVAAASSDAPAPAAETTATDEAAPASDSKYGVTLDGSRISKDYEGKPAIIVDYTFTNHSDETTSFMVAVHAKAFQDGIQLEPAMVLDDAEYSAENSMKDIRPGASIKVQDAFTLTSESPVELEVEELFSFSDAKLLEAELPAR